MTQFILKRKFILLVCLVTVSGFITSCKKDATATSGKIQLLSFGPTGARHGDTLRFVGNNLDKVTEIVLTGATIPASAFISKSSEVILIIIPQSTQEGYAILKTPDGDIMSKTKVNFLVPVAITSVTAQARPGDNISIKGDFMNWIKEVRFSKDLAETTFVSKSLTELIVKVPARAKTGTLFISTGGTKPLVIETVSPLVVTLPAITSFTPSPIARDANLTITGTNLDLVEGVSFKGINGSITTFVSKTATQLVVKVPAAANKGKVTLVAYSGLMVESTASLLFIGDLPDLAPLKYAFYIDDFQNGWQDWGWNRNADYKNTENVRDGVASIKLDYIGQWGALKFASKSVDPAPYSEITFSIYGTPGTGGKKINVMANFANAYVVTIEEGKWVEYKLTKAQLGNPAKIDDFDFQNQDWTGKIYIDHVGMR